MALARLLPQKVAQLAARAARAVAGDFGAQRAKHRVHLAAARFEHRHGQVECSVERRAGGHCVADGLECLGDASELSACTELADDVLELTMLVLLRRVATQQHMFGCAERRLIQQQLVAAARLDAGQPGAPGGLRRRAAKFK